MRYRYSKIQRDKKGKRYLTTGTIPDIPISENDVYVQVSTFDRLDVISQQFYNTPKFWWVIAAANGLGKGSIMIDKSAILRIPTNPNKIEEGTKTKGY